MFGDKVKKLRELRGLTQEELASATGFKPSYISAIETGNKENPPLNTIRAFARALKVRESYLIEENAVTLEELAESTGVEVPPDVAEFVMNKESLPYLILAKSLGEQKVPADVVEIAINSIMAVMKKREEVPNNK